MEKKTKLEEKNEELMKVLDMKTNRIWELEAEVMKLKHENQELKDAVEDFEATGAKWRPWPKQTHKTPGEKAKPKDEK